MAIDESILINNRLIKGSDLVDLAKQNGRLVYNKDNEELYELNSLHTYSLNKDLDLKRTKASVFLQKYNGKLLKITTESGRQISLTKNHPLLKEDLLWTSAYLIKKGDKIAISDFFIPPKKIKFGNWKKELKKKWYFLTYSDFLRLKKITLNFNNFQRCSSKDFNDLRIILNLRYNQIARNTGFSYSWITKLFRGEKDLTKNVIIRLNKFFMQINKKNFEIGKRELVFQTEKHYKRVSCKFKDVAALDEDIIKWISILNAEGYARNKGLVVVQKNYPQLLKEFMQISKNKFGINFGKVYTRVNDVTRFEIYSRPFIDYLIHKFNYKIGSSLKSQIPDWVFSLNRRYQGIFLKYFFDTESSVDQKGWKISLCQVNKKNINIISQLLNNFGIIHRFNTQIRKNKKNIEYYLNITGKNNLYKFIKHIGISDKNKLMRIKQHLAKLEGKDFFTKLDKKYKNILFDRVKSVEEINYDNYLIDLVVPKYHNFFAGYGGILCHNTTVLERLSGRWADIHSEEVKRGITIKLGYADASYYYCKKCDLYSRNETCEKCKEKGVLVKRVSFVDAPGHETLMATMLSGAAIMDAALLLVAANEPCPQPQTEEHLMALTLIGIKDIIIIQNKIDLVSKEDAIKNYNEIKKFVKGTIAENSTIIPVSAKYNINIDKIIGEISKLKTPARDLKKEPIMYIARSFDVNKPGYDIKNLVGGILGGSIKQGVLKVGEEIEIAPGIKKDEHKQKFDPVKAKIVNIKTGGESVKEAVAGGSIAILTELDPSIVKSDNLAGNILGLVNKIPPVYYELDLDVRLFGRVVGLKTVQKIDPVKKGEGLMINVNSSVSLGIVSELSKDKIHLMLKRPVCASPEDRFAISRRIENRWRLIGYGILKR